MNHQARKSILCPNCRKLISTDEPHCPHCGLKTPGSRFKNNPLTRGWGSGEELVRIIIIANVAMYIISLLLSANKISGGFSPFSALSPDEGLFILGASGTEMVRRAGWWTLLSANYLHGSLMHILFNMMAFNQIGTLVVRIYGPYRFFGIYTISGIGGFLVSWLFGTPLTVGASAAIFGLIGAAVYYGKSRGGLFGETIYKQLGGWAVAIIVLGFLLPNMVDNSAHIGGLVFGALVAYLFGYHENRREGALHRAIAGACMVLTIVILAFALFRGFIYWFGI